MVTCYCRHRYGRKYFCLTSQYTKINDLNYYIPVKMKPLDPSEKKQNYTYENFTQWNRSLCSIQSDRHGPNQKVISISIYGSTSNYTDNAMFAWETSIFPFLIPLANEVKLLLPSWIIRLYIDFTGSTKSQQNFLYNFSNIDICDIHNIPMFGSSLVSYLPGKMWRFLPIFDPFVDYFLSRDLDSPIMKRETETIDMWVSDKQKRYFFYIARDNKYHNVPILGGLWGASPGRARHYLYYIFQPMLVPSIAQQYKGAGDQQFLSDNVWGKVRRRSLSFDSYSCHIFGGRPFLSQRPLSDNCFLGCIRPCCITTTSHNSNNPNNTCPPACRPKDHQDWIYC
ncbi:unnamed protein product [Rotaria sordida]|uniref:Uncharacterized protein n=2 Tax=Rotaria sordida TaxID=392033 RepID=A0A815S726_9BILA|nr:unnamed protein product [Rotaria sordida]